MEKKKIYVVTPIYATTTEGDGATPLVHYFAREWVKMGCDVTVFNIVARFPRPYYWVGKAFQHKLNSKLGMLVPTHMPKDCDYEAEGVTVHKRTILKYKPHTEFTESGINYALKYITEECEKSGVPDYFIGHWGSPCMEILPALKQKFIRPISIVFHTNEFNLEKRYGANVQDILRQFDVIGYRSNVAKADFEKKYFVPERSFICYSGVSAMFLDAMNDKAKSFPNPVSKFAYVGSMIARKHSAQLYEALVRSYPEGNFSVKYIGNGDEVKTIESLKTIGEVEFTGRIPREQIVEHLKQADVFAMISEGEIFGLVYLEAMALGLITIGSRNEGIDGIIVDGENGFLCEAGNVEELTAIITKIRQMSPEELTRISANAVATAREFSDFEVAKKYVNTLF